MLESYLSCDIPRSRKIGKKLFQLEESPGKISDLDLDDVRNYSASRPGHPDSGMDDDDALQCFAGYLTGKC